MEPKERIKEYVNGDLTVIWKPAKCIHAAECVRLLPNVYKPEEKPWINAENATKEELINQINQCPSGALSYKDSQSPEANLTSDMITSIKVLGNGPLLITGELDINLADGQKEVKTPSAAFCRCGASSNKPYCDGSHKKINFVG